MARGRRAEEEAGEGDAGVPRPWLPIRRAVREVTVDGPPRIAEALWFCMSVALQRTQKSQNKRRPKGRGKKNRGVGGRNAASANAEAFSKVVDEYATHVFVSLRRCATGTILRHRLQRRFATDIRSLQGRQDERPRLPG